jgi:hypothetical protein
MVFDDIDLSIGHVGNASMSPNYKFTNSCSFCPTALTAACQCQPSQNVCTTSTPGGCDIVCQAPL